MYRKIWKELIAWKKSQGRKPLILNGARQVGKTYILKEFGAKEFKNFAYLNCDKNPRAAGIFSDFDTERIIRAISAVTETVIEKENTLIFIDEIQEIPNAVSCLKYFCEDAPEYYIVAAGSLLGIRNHEGAFTEQYVFQQLNACLTHRFRQTRIVASDPRTEDGLSAVERNGIFHFL